MALFIRQGMVAWMNAWPKTHNPPGNNITKHQIPGTASKILELPQSLQTQITMLLADMILNQSHQEAIL